MLDTEIKNKIVNALLPLGPEKIILFGSYGYGVPDKKSDIDILVIKDIPEQDVRKLRLKIKKILWENFGSQNLHFDVLVDSEKRVFERIKIGDLFFEEIYNKGQVIYA